jgi:hypothetical protein
MAGISILAMAVRICVQKSAYVLSALSGLFKRRLSFPGTGRVLGKPLFVDGWRPGTIVFLGVNLLWRREGAQKPVGRARDRSGNQFFSARKKKDWSG